MSPKSVIVSPIQKDIDRAGEIYRILISIYGTPEWQEPLSAVDELVSTILSQNTNDTNRDRAYNSLRAKFSTWESVRDAPVDEVIEAVRVAGLANQKGSRIKSILKEISAERGELSLDFLRNMRKDEALDWLKQHKGVGPKTASIVLQFSLGISAFPVDTHVYRVSGRTGIRPNKLNVERTHTWMEQLFDPKQYGPGHLNFIKFGREICHARKPECPICPINHICSYFKNLPDKEPNRKNH